MSKNSLRKAHTLLQPYMDPLSHPNFRIFLLGQAASLVGSWMQTVGHGWIVVMLTESATLIAMVHLATSVPIALFMILGGVLADRYERRSILLVTRLIQALLAFVYGFFVFTGRVSLGLIFFLAFALGLTLSFDLPAQQALIPRLVPAMLIPYAVALNLAVFHAARVFGPMLTRVLMRTTPLASIFFVNGIFLIISFACLVIIHPATTSESSPFKGWRILLEAFSFIRRHRYVWILFGLNAISIAFIFPFLNVFIPVIVKDLYHGNQSNLAAILSASGLGAWIGALLIGQVPPSFRGKAIVSSCAFVSISLASISFIDGIRFAMILVSILTLFLSLAQGLASAILQLIIPDQLRGRVLSANILLFYILLPLASVGAGTLSDVIGLRSVLMFMGLSYGGISIWWLIRGGIWSYDEGLYLGNASCKTETEIIK